MSTMIDLGEKAFINGLLPLLPTHPTFVNGFGHDASVIDVGFGEQCLIVKIDRAASAIATEKGWDNYKLWGRVAVTSNCSDILASGGCPKAVMISMVLPPHWNVDDAKDIVLGCSEECILNDIAFVGGDTKEGKSAQLIGCAVGIVRRDRILNRNGGRPGDKLLIAGPLGGFMGSYLQLEYDSSSIEDVEKRKALLKYVCHPSARWREARVVNNIGGPVAAMDTSDGLFDVLKTFSGPNFGVELNVDSLPFHDHARKSSELFDIPLINFAFGVGDWNIIYAVPAERADRLVAEVRDKNGSLHQIGQIIDRKGIFARSSEQLYSVNGIINEHFRVRMEDVGDYISRIRNDTTLQLID